MAVSSVDGAMALAAEATPGTACLVDLADAPRLAELVQTLQAAGWVLCGAERSAEAVAQLRRRCVDGGVDLRATYVVEGAEWKCNPFGRFEA